MRRHTGDNLETYKNLTLAVGSVALAISFRSRGTKGEKHRPTLSWTDLEARLKELLAKDIENSRARSDGPMDVTQLRGEGGRHYWDLMGSSKLRGEGGRHYWDLMGSSKQ